jgi:ornithine cyclodeaminase/alanine dehydrogenase-like protein (mu-crystallin family)
MRVITADEISHSVEPLDLVDAMREAFVSISRSRVRTTFSLLDLDAGDMHVKAAHDVGGDVYVVKVASAVPTNRERGLPVGNGGILICSAITGQPRAFLVDEHDLTDARIAREVRKLDAPGESGQFVGRIEFWHGMLPRHSRAAGA